MLRKYTVSCRRFIGRSRWTQVLLFIGFWFLGQAVSQLFHLPIPGGVIGFILVLALLYMRVIRVRSLALGAEWFLAEMLLFFIPAVPAVLNHREFLGWTGLKILAIIALGTIIVMISTAFVVEICLHKIGKSPEKEAE